LVHGIAIAAVGLVDYTKALVRVEIPLNYVTRPVLRAIIYADDLEILEALGDKRGQALVEISLNVIDGYENRDHDVAVRKQFEPFP
jgi:hypothetical protein